MTYYPIWKGMLFSVCMLAVSVLPAAALEKDDFNLQTTEDLLALCSLPQEHGDYSSASYSCMGFIRGVVQFHDGISDKEHIPRLICYPEGTTVAEGRAVFVEWGKKTETIQT